MERTVKNATGDRAVAAARLPAGACAGADRVLALGAFDALCRGSRLPHPAIRLRLALFARPRRQRRTEDHGHHCGATLFARVPRHSFRDPVLGGTGVPGRDGAGHADGRLAYRPHHGPADHPPDPDAGVLRRNRRRRDPVHGDLSWGARLHHPHHHRRHRRGRRGATDVGGAVERRELDRVRLGHHDPGLGDRGCTDMVGHQDLRPVTVSPTKANSQTTLRRFVIGLSQREVRAWSAMPLEAEVSSQHGCCGEDRLRADAAIGVSGGDATGTNTMAETITIDCPAPRSYWQRPLYAR